jgi:ubiquitin carboxyl-terminal hydrolase 34
MLARLIRSTQMQLRVMAIEIMSTELISSWRRTRDREIDPQDPFLNHQGRYLLRINLVDYLISPNCHPEVTSGSSNIIGFLVVTNLYSATHADRLWQGITESQDPRVARALTELNSSITNLLDHAALLSLCEKFQTLPIQDFNQPVLFFCSYVLRELILRCQRDGSALGLLPYELCLRLLRESSVCTSDSQTLYPEVQSEAIARLDNLVAFGMDDEDRQRLYSSCVEDVAAKSPTAMGSLCCLQFAMKGNVAGELTVLVDKFDFARLLVEELAHAIDIGRAAGMPVVFSGASNRPRRDFVTKIIYHRPDALSGDLGKKLWSLLVGTACLGDEDRNSGWEVIMAFDRETAAGNPFLQSCYSLYLPSLPPSCFCRGMLNCVIAQIFHAVNDNAVDCALDDESYIQQSGLEQLWRIILNADDAESVSIGIKALAVDVYMDSRAILTYPFNRARHVQSSFVDRCLGQLRDAARKIKASSDGISSGEDEPMVIVASEDDIHEQERIFTRTLQLLRLFVETHYTKPALCAPDFRPFVNQDPNEVEGDLTMLQYQSFDNGAQTEMKPLHIGKLNTTASLLSILKLATGFNHYRVFYQGQQFLPTEEEICKSLESLDVNEGLILVRREEDDDDAVSAARVKPGSSPIEIQVLSRFQELWMYLGMEDAIAKEVYSLLVQLPTDGGIIDLFESPTVTHTEMFPPRQPYKSLYVIRALTEYIESIRLIESSDEMGIKALRFSRSSYEEALRKSYSLIVQAISNESFLDQINPALQTELMEALMATFVRLLQNTWLSSGQPVNDGVTYPSPSRLVEILSYASNAMQEGSESLIDRSIAAILRLCLVHDAFMEEIASLGSFTDLLKSLILLNPRSTVRSHVVEMIREAVEAEEGLVPSESDAIVSSYPLTRFAWSTISSFLSETISVPSQCHEYFGGLEYLLYKAFQIMPSEVDMSAVAAQVCELLLNHDSTESLDQLELQDVLANDLLSILLGCLQVDEALPASPTLPDDIVQKLFWRHLFPKQRSRAGQPVQKVLLRSDTRQRLYQIILRLAESNQAVLGPLLRSLNSLVPYYADDRDGHYIYDLPCQFNREKAIKPYGYVGLRNLSNTCYLNALVTQLFMNTQFRQFILGLDIPNDTSSQQLLFHAQKLLAYMQESHYRFVDPELFVGSIRTYEDTYIDIHNQMDVDEFYNLLFDRLEAQLTTDDQKRTLRGIYGGQLVQQIKSQECTHVSERFEPFSAIQCDINGKRTLQESLEAYVGGEIMEGGE